MSINFVKTVGWLLLFAGLGLIVHSVTVSYDYFTKKAAFPALIEAPVALDQIASAPGATVDLADPKAVQAMMQAQVQNSVNQTINNLVPGGSVVKLLNAAIWSVFATFLVYAGAKISQIGASMLVTKEKHPD